MPSRLIFVVDDSVEIRTALTEALADSGFVTAVAEDGRAALEQLQGGLRPDLILLDLMMPRMDGTEFRQRQLEDPAMAHIPVVLMTSFRAVDQGPLKLKRVLWKPFTVPELLAAVAR